LKKVEPEECLTRYAIEKSYYRPSDRTVRHNAFMPPVSNQELSVFRISNLSQNVIWDLGKQYVANPRNKPLLGRVDIFASNVFEKGLKIRPENQPHVLHANIIDWPEEREEQRLIAIELASEANFICYNA
jgi:hypothetical protein